MSSERKTVRGHSTNEMIVALLSSSSIASAAAALGVSELTIYRHLRKPSFKEQYDAAKRRLLDGAISKLQLASAGAVDVLVSIAANEFNPAPSRVNAAKAIIELAIKASAVESLEQRIAELESRTIDFTPADTTWGGHESPNAFQTIRPIE